MTKIGKKIFSGKVVRDMVGDPHDIVVSTVLENVGPYPSWFYQYVATDSSAGGAPAGEEKNTIYASWRDLYI